MLMLSAAELLDAWERGLDQPLTTRILTLLTTAFSESSYDELAELPIGRRDAHLLQLREMLFGSQLTAVTACPGCGEHLESTLQVAELRLDQAYGTEVTQVFDVDSYRVRFRLPTSNDLIALGSTTDISAARKTFLRRCLMDIKDTSGEPVVGDALPVDVVSAIAMQMSAADPQADMEINLTCPACEYQWQATFDIASFLWREIHAWAHKILREVHSLARAYGWREADVLALSPTRRQIYLEMSRQ